MRAKNALVFSGERLTLAQERMGLEATKIAKDLMDHKYRTSQEISKAVKVSVWTVRQRISQMRRGGKGIVTTRQGYCLAEHASQKDDHSFLKRVYGLSYYLNYSYTACIPHMQKRWTSVDDKRVLKQLLEPVRPAACIDKNQFDTGIKLLSGHQKMVEAR